MEVLPMARPKKLEQELVVTTIRAPRDFWSKVRTQAFNEAESVGGFILKVLAEYLKKEAR
jgi:hypothetical protein